MNLDENQKQQVALWLNDGLKLAEVQKKLEQDFGIKLTYMEVKLLVSDLDLRPKDPVVEKPVAPPAPQTPTDNAAGQELGGAAADAPFPEEDLPPASPSNVKVTVDQIARPGAMISGKVNFANGKVCEWMLDQMGRLGLVPAADGYKPTAAEVQEFQVALQIELQKMGF